jgi:hypothetical protein
MGRLILKGTIISKLTLLATLYLQVNHHYRLPPGSPVSPLQNTRWFNISASHLTGKTSIRNNHNT